MYLGKSEHKEIVSQNNTKARISREEVEALHL